MISGMGRRFKHRQLEFWAQNGLIHVVDNRKSPPEHTTDSLKEFLLRAQSFVDERNRVQHRITVGAGSMGTRVGAETVKELQALIEDMIACTRFARHQGDPFDKRVQEHVRRHGAIGAGRSVLVPGPAQVVELNRPRPLSELAPRRGARGRAAAADQVRPDTLREYRGGS